MPSVKGSSSSLMVAVDWAGTHLTQPQMSLFSVQTVCEKEKEQKKGAWHYPNGTLLWSHRCVQPKSLLEMTSDIGEDCSLKETEWTILPLCFGFSGGGKELSLCFTAPCLSPFTWPVDSDKLTNGFIGDLGELKDPTEGGEVNEAGARTVIVRSSDVKFDAWRVKTWHFDKAKIKYLKTN